MAAAYRIRRQFFGNRVQLYFLMNAKSGLCPEDCGYCSQSKVSEAEIPRYNLLNAEKLLDGARVAAERQAKTYCIVISARGPSNREMDAITTIVPQIKSQYNLKICACLGLLTPDQAAAAQGLRRRPGESQPQHQRELLRRDLHDAHLSRSRRHARRRCATPAWSCAPAASSAWAKQDADVVRMAFALRDLEVESIPVNFLNPIDGTPLAGMRDLNPRYCLKVLAMFRFANPDRETADRRRPRAAPGQPAAAGPVCGQLDLRRRLSDDQGPGPGGRLQDDRGAGLRSGPQRRAGLPWRRPPRARPV